MSEMIVRVAKAIDRQMSSDDNHPVDLARAAIQAMRDPTEEMARAVGKLSRLDLIVPEHVYDEYDSDSADLSPEAPALLWKAMIDAALGV